YAGRLRDEIASLQQIRSNHVTDVYDIIQLPGGEIGIVEEYIPGSDLASVDFKTIKLDKLLKILYQISQGIFDIHNASIVHRDLKPTNMKFDSEGRLKIFDFNLARIVSTPSHTKGFRGTLGFAPPELFVQGTVNLSLAIDVYAFGAIAWCLANGTLPASL